MTPLALLLSLIAPVTADPCGMVPPLNLDMGSQLQRDGAQRTYVMHSRGVETMVLRPGFIGDVEHFGMLIPFPSVPAIRKIDDDTFAQIEAAIDPPQVQVHIYDPYMLYEEFDDMPLPSMAVREEAESGLAMSEVNVVKEEAVGMYQVAVLEAGSPKALARWMEDNGYRYPDGMDDVVGDYVQDKWCFVAVKAKVGGNQGAVPHPGMRSAPMERPAGSSFDGHVQGMGFRFTSEDPVVPMRLSVFNGEGPRNVVYMLAEQPLTIQGADPGLVVRQRSGEELYANLTTLLPLQFSGGTRKDITQESLDGLAPLRDPTPYVGLARVLFASDLLAARTGTLALEHEEAEKELLNISEALGLRGDDVDSLHRTELTQQRELAVDGALEDIKEMHMSVIDGVLPTELIAGQNLGFERYEMPKAANQRREDPIRPAAPSTSVPRKDSGGGIF